MKNLTQDLLFHAAHAGDLTLMRQLLEADASLADSRDIYRRNALHAASTMDGVHLLLQHGASPHSMEEDLEDDERLSVVDRQAQDKRFEIAEFLQICQQVGYNKAKESCVYSGKLKEAKEREWAKCWPTVHGERVSPPLPTLGKISRVQFSTRHFTEEDRWVGCNTAVWYAYLLEAALAVRENRERAEILSQGLRIEFSLSVNKALIVPYDANTVSIPGFITQGIVGMCRHWELCSPAWKVDGYGSIRVTLTNFLRGPLDGLYASTLLGTDSGTLEWHMNFWGSRDDRGQGGSPELFIASHLAPEIDPKAAQDAFEGDYDHRLVRG